MRRKIQALLLAALSALMAAGCGAMQDSQNSSGGGMSVNIPAASQAPASASGIPTPASEAPDPASPEYSLRMKAAEAAEILRSRDLERLRGMIDPDKGLIFSPYAYIDEEVSLKFMPQELPDFKDSLKRTWGYYDGTGEPIELTFLEYFEKFVYNRDFASAPEVHVNTLKGTGNSPFNGLDIFPGASYVEFHYPGFDKQYEGMDWESLILVMLPDGEDWKLCAIVHASWTI